MESDEEVLQDACAVFGCVTSLEVAESVNISNIIYLGLMALQHRYEHYFHSFFVVRFIDLQ